MKKKSRSDCVAFEQTVVPTDVLEIHGNHTVFVFARIPKRTKQQEYTAAREQQTRTRDDK